MVGEAAALGSAASWAVSAVLIKGISTRRSAFYIMAARTAVAGLLALIVFAVVRPASPLDLPASTIVVLLVSAAVAISGDVAFVRAMAVEDVSRVFTVSTSLYILVSVAGSVVFYGDALSPWLLLGGLAVLVGSRLVIHQPAGAATTARSGRKPMFALWLSVVAALFWSASLLAVSRAMESVEPLTATAMRMPFMAVALVLFAASRGEHRQALAPRDASMLALSGALIGASMLLFLAAAKLSDAGTVAVLTSTSPIFVAPLAHFFLSERLTPRIATGTMTCMLGIWLASI